MKQLDGPVPGKLMATGESRVPTFGLLENWERPGDRCICDDMADFLEMSVLEVNARYGTCGDDVCKNVDRQYPCGCGFTHRRSERCGPW